MSLKSFAIPAAGVFALGFAAPPSPARAAPLPAGAGVALGAVDAPVVQVQSRRVVRASGPRRSAGYRARGNRNAVIAAGAILGAIATGAVAASRSRAYDDGYAYVEGPVHGGYGYDAYAPAASGFYGYDGYAPVASGYYGSGSYAPARGHSYGQGYYSRGYRGYDGRWGGAYGGSVTYGQGHAGTGYYENGGRYLGAPAIGGPAY